MTKVDISQVERLTREAEKRLGSVPQTMKGILDAAMDEERRTHAYRNYTHRLEGSTFALGPFERSDEAEIIAGARMEYASHVEQRGRTRVRELTLKAAKEIELQLTIGDGEDLSRI